MIFMRRSTLINHKKKFITKMKINWTQKYLKINKTI